MHTMDMLGAFSALRVEVPLSTSRVPAAIEALEARRQYYLTKRAQARHSAWSGNGSWDSIHVWSVPKVFGFCTKYEFLVFLCLDNDYINVVCVCCSLHASPSATFSLLHICKCIKLVFGVEHPPCGAGKGERRGRGGGGQRARHGERPLQAARRAWCFPRSQSALQPTHCGMLCLSCHIACNSTPGA